MHPADRRRTKKKPGVPRASSCDAAGYCTCGGSVCVADSSESCALASTVRRRLTSCTSSMSSEPADWSSSRSEEHTSELQSLMRISYAVFCLKKKTTKIQSTHPPIKQIKYKPTKQRIKT